MNNNYPLTLKMELASSLLNSDKYNKLDIHNVYQNVRISVGDKDKLVLVCQVGQFYPLTMPFRQTIFPGIPS